ncbi:hypothetical protein ACFFRR_006142 [Megaselia abdita]
MICDRVIIVLANVFILLTTLASGDKVAVEPLGCKPEFTISTTLSECYNYNDKITINFKTSCFPINLDLEVVVCDQNSCKGLFTICPYDTSFEIILNDFFYVGGSFCIRIRTKNITLVETGYFNVSEPSIVIESTLSDYCYAYGDLISIDFTASCFPPKTTIFVVACDSGNNCFKLGYVSSDIGKVDIELDHPFSSGETYTISIQSKSGTVSGETEPFTIEESCECSPSIEFTSSVESCYVYKDVFIISYKLSCIPLNSDLQISICTADGVCTEIGVASTCLSLVNIKIISPFLIGGNYYISLTYGKATAKTGIFLVCVPELRIRNELEAYYELKDV